MNILLTGASGFIGRHIKQALIQNTAVTLLTPSHQEADYNRLTTAEDWLPLLEGVDIVINSVGIISETRTQSFTALHHKAPIALFEACEQSNVNRVIQISALGADNNAFTPYQTSKLAADNALRQTTLSWFILRPSLVYGEGGASLALFKRLASLPLIPLPSAGKQMVQPVHISDLVAAVLCCIEDEVEPHQTIDIVGYEAVSLADYIQTIRTSMGKKKAFIIPVPNALLIPLSHFIHRVIHMLHPDNLRMLQQGNTADPTPITQLLGRPPLKISEGLLSTGENTRCI